MIPGNLKILMKNLSCLTFLKILPGICVLLDMLFYVGLKGD